MRRSRGCEKDRMVAKTNCLLWARRAYLVEGEKSPEKPQSLRGDWSDAFSDGFDVDAELKEIRGEWQKEWRGDEFVG